MSRIFLHLAIGSERTMSRGSHFQATVERRFRLARLWSNEELRKISGAFKGRIANVSAGDNVDKEGSTYDAYFRNATEFWITNHRPGAFRGFQGRPNELLLDLSTPVGPELVGNFDVVFNHTTLEHIFEVETAFGNLCKISRDIVIVIVPFVQVQHENAGYLDFWRFTPTCLRRLFSMNDLEVIYESASPDHDAAIYLFFVGSRHPERWRDKMPAFRELQEVGSWIGSPEPGWRRRIANWSKRLKNILKP